MAPTIENHYATLGVRRTASAADIRAAYLAMARDLHPDRHMGSPPAERARAERVMRKVNEAWDVLRDPGRKATYDERLEQLSPRASPPPRTPPPRTPPPRSSSHARTPPPRSQGSRPYSSAGRPGGTTTRSGTSSTGSGRTTPRPTDEDDDDTDLAEVSPTTALLARVIPIGLLVGVLFFLLIVTALAGGNSSDTGTDNGTDPGTEIDPGTDTGTGGPGSATSTPGGPPVALDLSDATCATVIDAGGVLYPQRADCAGPHDAIIAAEASSPDACPDGTDGLPFGGRALCLIFPDA